jgi:hypothetical protein
VRGSPLIRFFLLTLALSATGIGLQRLTAAKVTAEAPAETRVSAPVVGTQVPFRLVLSATADEVRIDTGKTMPALALENSPIIGKLELDAENPHLAIVVRWKNPPAAGEHRFAKLTLEAPGQATFTHVFDADGDINDFLELPLPTAK